MSTPLLPLGSKLQRQHPSTLVFEDIPQVISMGFPGATQEFDDITNMDSPSGFRERVATVKAPTDMAVELLYNPALAMHNTMIDDAASNPVPLRTFRVLFPNLTDGFQFTAYPGSPTGNITAVAAARTTINLGISGNITRLA
jgi:hypothetical protein